MAPMAPIAPIALIGGNEDRLSPGIVLRELAALCRADLPADAPFGVVVLSTASGEPELLWSHYGPAFRALGAEPRWLDVRSRDDAEHPDTLAAVRDARLLFMTGGDQERLTEVVAGTALHALIQARHRGGELVVAGTSAGASALGAHMPVGDLTEPFAGAIAPASITTPTPHTVPAAFHPGFGLLPRLVIDQHFAQRKRHGRLLHLVTLDPRHLGVGIDEDTALLIEPGIGVRVVGSGAVTLIDAARASDRRTPLGGFGAAAAQATPAPAAGDAVVALENLGIYLLPAGTVLRLDAGSDTPPHLRRVTALLATPAVATAA